jgi:hypothetical protein
MPDIRFKLILNGIRKILEFEAMTIAGRRRPVTV